MAGRTPVSSPGKTPRDGSFDPDHIVTVSATEVDTKRKVTISYRAVEISGHGSFGVVLKAQLVGGGSGVVALKRTKQDRRYKNRELAIMLAISHPNIVKLRFYYYEGTGNEDEVYLNLVLDHIPETIYRTYRNYTKRRQAFPEVLVKVYMHQLFRALSYLHSMGICHRDLKPHNLLDSPEDAVLSLIDFGSAKVLKVGEPNVSYTCSRYYRAPELIFGSTRYTNTIDLWSTGCILGELLQGSVFFPGTSGIDQLVEIIKVLGTPTRDQIKAMNPNYMEHKFPQIKPVPLSRLLPKSSKEAVDLLSRLLTFDPCARLSACEAMTHPFFDEIKVPGALLPNGRPLPPLFNFTRHELSIRPDLIRQLVPAYTEQKLWDEHQIDLSNFVPLDVTQLRVEID